VTAPHPDHDVVVLAAVDVRPSALSGQGLFAVESLAAGAPVARLGGRLVTTDELLPLFDHATAYVDTITVAPEVHLVLPDGSPVHFVNHSCEPNLAMAGPYDVVAARPITAGEELTIDYRPLSGAPGAEGDCRCGTPSCGGRIPF
jgi:SET domain-containing protein